MITGAHPRSRGENELVDMFYSGQPGSSPLTRGKPAHACVDQDSVGLIPAHAGKTLRGHLSVSFLGAHPRSRGENITVSTGWEIVEGSSPLTRGKPHHLGCDVRDTGLIPAHAGKTRIRSINERRGEAHPRSRGENVRLYPTLEIGSGSSPLTRGKRKAITGEDADFGLIPAHAGKTN